MENWVSWDHYFLGSCANDEIDEIDDHEIDDHEIDDYEIDDHEIDVDDDVDDDDDDDDDDVLVEDGNPFWCTRLVNDTTMRPEFSTRCVEVWSNMTCQRVFTNKACCACREHVYMCFHDVWGRTGVWSCRVCFQKWQMNLKNPWEQMNVYMMCSYMVLVEMILFIQTSCIFHIQIPS